MHAVVSIDIGRVNLGWTIFASEKSFKKGEAKNISDISITFGIFNITERLKDNKLVKERCRIIHDFWKRIASNFTVDYVIIEKQVNINTIAMELMYSICTAAQFLTESADDVIMFDPKLKFTWLGLAYTRENKAHKAQSVNICRSILVNTVEDESLIDKFDKFEKKDDIADSFNQAFDWLIYQDKINYTFADIRKNL